MALKKLRVKMIPVQSSNIEKVGYSEDKGSLFVRFHNGGIWTYNPVDQSVYNEMMAAESIGSYFVKNIKNNKELICLKL